MSLPQWLAGVEESRRFRSNLGLVNPGDTPLDVEIEATTDAGESLGTVAVTVPPRSLQLLPRVAARFTGGSFCGSLRTALLGAARPWQVWESVVDAQSGDPVFVHSAAVPEGS